MAIPRRRALLVAAVAAAVAAVAGAPRGAAAVQRVTTSPPPAHCKVVVVGGGIGGAYAAWRMVVDSGKVDGKDVCLFEAADRFGGRIRTVSDVPGFEGYTVVRFGRRGTGWGGGGLDRSVLLLPVLGQRDARHDQQLTRLHPFRGSCAGPSIRSHRPTWCPCPPGACPTPDRISVPTATTAKTTR